MSRYNELMQNAIEFYLDLEQIHKLKEFTQLPSYQSHKVVKALKITSLYPYTEERVLVTVEELSNGGVLVSTEFIEKHKPEIGGYIVIYLYQSNRHSDKPHDKVQYISYSPAIAFSTGYSNNNEFSTVASVTSYLKLGKMIRRKAWSPGWCIFLQSHTQVENSGIPNIQSLPSSVKEELIRREVKDVSFENQIAMLRPYNIIQGWSPTIEDILATDWELFKQDDKVAE